MLAAISNIAVFLARARNIPLGARIEHMATSRTVPGYCFLDVIWSASFQTSLALALPAKANRKARRKKGAPEAVLP
jgi:hypothetical protein